MDQLEDPEEEEEKIKTGKEKIKRGDQIETEIQKTHTHTGKSEGEKLRPAESIALELQQTMRFNLLPLNKETFHN